MHHLINVFHIPKLPRRIKVSRANDASGLCSLDQLTLFLDQQLPRVRNDRPLALIALTTAEATDLTETNLWTAAIAVQSVARWPDVAAWCGRTDIVMAMPQTPRFVGEIIGGTLRQIMEEKHVAAGISVTVAESAEAVRSSSHLIDAARLSAALMLRGRNDPPLSTAAA